MSEKSPRRAPLALTAEQLDYKQSQARTENKRARNRLHINKDILSGHQSTNVNSLDYEMRRLKHELRGIKQTSGYFVVNHDNPDESARIRHRHRRKSKVKVSKKKHPTSSNITDSIIEEVRESTNQNTNTVSLPVLPTISSASSDSSGKNGSKSQESIKINDINSYNHDNTTRITVTLETKPKLNRKISNSTNLNTSDTTFTKDPERTTNSDEKDFNGDRFWGVNFEAARNRVQNRLATNDGSNTTTFQVEDNDDLTPYMHVPPDGLPRTAYLLPPLEQLLTEAKKARYIRKLRKRDTILEADDPERELGIDEIFGKR